MFMQRALSGFLRRLNPSAILAGTDTAARRICDTKPYNSCLG